MIVSSRKGLANRVRRFLEVNDLHIPVANATQDLDIDAAGGGRRRRKTHNQRLRAARRFGMGQEHNPAIQASLCILSWWVRFLG